MTLTYDPLGRLFQVSTTAPTTTRFLYDGAALVAEYDGAGTLTRRYVHGVGADVPVMSYSYTNGVLSQFQYLHANHQGSVIALSDGSPTNFANPAYAINTYDEYGIPGAANSGRFQYTGQIWLSELGMYHYKARVYSPTLGRFLQVDPIGYEGGVNLYGYVGNDPVNMNDPTGRDAWLVSRPTVYGSTHSFVVVAPSLGGPVQARFSYGPDWSNWYGGNLISTTGSGDSTDRSDVTAWARLSNPVVAYFAGVTVSRIEASDAAVLDAGRSVDRALGTRANPGGVGYEPLVDMTAHMTTGNSNSAAYAVATMAGQSRNPNYRQANPPRSRNTGRESADNIIRRARARRGARRISAFSVDCSKIPLMPGYKCGSGVEFQY